MLMIRLQRIGRKHEPAYRLVLTDSKNSTKSGKFLEILGNYDARRGEQATFKEDRISHWMTMGAQVSDTVHNLLVDKKLISAKKINSLPKKSAPKPVVVEVAAEVVPEVTAQAPVAETPAVESAPAVEAESTPEVIETPVETPSEAPIETSVETPSEAPIETSVETPSEEATV